MAPSRNSSATDTATRRSSRISTKLQPPKVKPIKRRSRLVIPSYIKILGVGNESGKNYKCKICLRKFNENNNIKYHEPCKTGIKPLTCKICAKGFITKSHYQYHIRTHTGERPFPCPQCGKKFNQRGKVTRHMRTHSGEKPFTCQECNKGFSNNQALQCHKLIHTGVRPYACPYPDCDKSFTGMTNLKKHRLIHTGERPFGCTQCGKRFIAKWNLDAHMRTHSTERPYACRQCTWAFPNKKDLDRHLFIHSGERPFKCLTCGCTFRRTDNLSRHLVNVHQQPKEEANQLAKKASTEYYRKNFKDQSPGNVPESRVNSVITTSIIKDKNLMEGSGSSSHSTTVGTKKKSKNRRGKENKKEGGNGKDGSTKDEGEGPRSMAIPIPEPSSSPPPPVPVTECTLQQHVIADDDMAEKLNASLGFPNSPNESMDVELELEADPIPEPGSLPEGSEAVIYSLPPVHEEIIAKVTDQEDRMSVAESTNTTSVPVGVEGDPSEEMTNPAQESESTSLLTSVVAEDYHDFYTENAAEDGRNAEVVCTRVWWVNIHGQQYNIKVPLDTAGPTSADCNEQKVPIRLRNGGLVEVVLRDGPKKLTEEEGSLLGQLHIVHTDLSTYLTWFAHI